MDFTPRVFGLAAAGHVTEDVEVLAFCFLLLLLDGHERRHGDR